MLSKQRTITSTITTSINIRTPFKTERLSENWTKRIELFSEIRKISLLDGVQKVLEKLELIGIAKRILKVDFHNFSVNGLQ